MKMVKIVIFLIFFSKFTLASFAVYYGDISASNINELSKFDLLILSPLVEEDYIKELKSKNVTVVGYLSLATIGGWEPWAEDVPDGINGILGNMG